MKVSPAALSLAILTSRNAPVRAFSAALRLRGVSSSRLLSPASSSSGSAATATACAMSTVAEPAATAANPLLESDGLPKFSKIEPSQLTPAMTSILEKLDADFAAMESSVAASGEVGYDDVLPVVERMQHPLGELVPRRPLWAGPENRKREGR